MLVTMAVGTTSFWLWSSGIPRGRWGTGWRITTHGINRQRQVTELQTVHNSPVVHWHMLRQRGLCLDTACTVLLYYTVAHDAEEATTCLEIRCQRHRSGKSTKKKQYTAWYCYISYCTVLLYCCTVCRLSVRSPPGTAVLPTNHEIIVHLCHVSIVQYIHTVVHSECTEIETSPLSLFLLTI